MTDQVRRCNGCGETKPLDNFPKSTAQLLGHGYTCKPCLAAEQRAQRAGMRKGKCAICGGYVEGTGICYSCQEHVRLLGGLEGLKRAVRAVRYLEE